MADPQGSPTSAGRLGGDSAEANKVLCVRTLFGRTNVRRVAHLRRYFWSAFTNQKFSADFSNLMNGFNPVEFKTNSKLWDPYAICLINRTANLAQMTSNWAIVAVPLSKKN